MRSFRTGLLAGVLAFLAAAAHPAGPTDEMRPDPVVHEHFAANPRQFAVLTYNVHGLPWPVAEDRTRPLKAIAGELAALHRSGRAPQVAVIQEAFTPQARALALTSGYRYYAVGPGESANSTPPLPAGMARLLAPSGHWWNGEGIGKWEGSGLMLLSDYPILNVQRLTFSPSACAGYDCLAAKGAMLVALALPGGERIDVATAHLNSRHASGVSNARSNRAWLVQAAELSRFVAKARDPRAPLVLAGDFNVGRDTVRQHEIADFERSLDPQATEGLHALAASVMTHVLDLKTVLQRDKDLQITLRGMGTMLAARSAAVPFGRNNGSPLSDHFGYSIIYEIRRGALAQHASSSA